MQGWRTSMEDAHLSAQIDNDTTIFGVFDGHGGKEVAIFVANHFVNELKKNNNFKKKDFIKALKETFLALDKIMETPNGMKELWNLQRDW